MHLRCKDAFDNNLPWQARVRRYYELVDRSRDVPDADTKVDFATSGMMRQGMFIHKQLKCINGMGNRYCLHLNGSILLHAFSNFSHLWDIEHSSHLYMLNTIISLLES